MNHLDNQVRWLSEKGTDTDVRYTIGNTDSCDTLAISKSVGVYRI